jgi:hypothetical protein
VKIPQIRIPVGTSASGQTPKESRYTHGKITPMFITLYAKAEYGDITLMRPEDFLAKTPVVFINAVIA